MTIGLPPDLTWYRLLQEQGGFIAGLLAFMAGLLAYFAGRASAAAVNRQNEAMKRSERRALARSTLIAARLIDGVLIGIGEDIAREVNFVAQLTGGRVNQELVLMSWRTIRKPALSTVWAQLGALNPEVISKYIGVDRIITTRGEPDFRRPTEISINQMRTDLQEVESIVSALRGFLEGEFRRANTVLAD